MTMTRRVFMKAGAAAVVGLGAVPRFLIRAAFAASENGNTKPDPISMRRISWNPPPPGSRAHPTAG